MTFRERLADWISGGAVTRARNEYDGVRHMLTDYRLAYPISVRAHAAEVDISIALLAALRRIDACETPGANATVRRMARIAREAME